MLTKPPTGKKAYPGLAFGLIAVGALALTASLPKACPKYAPDFFSGFSPARAAVSPGGDIAEGDQPASGSASREFSLLACGDILLARTPGKRAEANGFRYLFQGVRDLVSEADIAFANLETPASYLGTPWPGKPPVVTFRADPATLFGLAWAGFDVVSLANNHMNDYGPRALEETLDYLDLLGVARAGAGMSLEDARRPAIISIEGSTFAFISYAEPIWSVREAKPLSRSPALARAEAALHGPLPLAADPGDDSSSAAGVAHAEIGAMIADVRRIRETLSPDYLFVSVHWGEEHMHYPNAAQRAFGRAAIDAGATAVLGHHPHVLQGVERWGSGIIMYSMGNFVFDMAADSTYRTAAFRLSLADGAIAGLEIFPVAIERYVYAPSVAAGAEGQEILLDLKRWSAVLGTEVAVMDGKGYVKFR